MRVQVGQHQDLGRQHQQRPDRTSRSLHINARQRMLHITALTKRDASQLRSVTRCSIIASK